jgi:hypothetical protein
MKDQGTLALALELGWAADLLAAISERMQTIDLDGERYFLITEAERMDALRERVIGNVVLSTCNGQVIATEKRV